MKTINEAISYLGSDEAQETLKKLYVDETLLDAKAERIKKTIKEYEDVFGATDIEIYSAPGRSEIGGNHTDHQRGEILAASINNDAIAIVGRRGDSRVSVKSAGYKGMIEFDIEKSEKADFREGTSWALVAGVLHKLKENGHKIGGFDAYVTSDVLSGSGLSSSAAFETLIGTIISGLYNDMTISAEEIAKVGQYAENVYFGKPCGLMDQMACSVGSLCHIDFREADEPKVERIDADIKAMGYSLCITDTKGSHANLTPEYAAVPAEMRSVAAVFGKEVLIEVDEKDVIDNIGTIREKCSDRALLRALHFYEENKRVRAESAALKAGDFAGFLKAFRASGRSSFQYLQNVYASSDPGHQNTSVGLLLSDIILGDAGAARIHGGGFAGTIQAFVPHGKVEEYRSEMDRVYGKGSCSVLQIRSIGGTKIF